MATSESLFAVQDKAAEKSRKLAAEGKYYDAIRIMKEEVISPLELESAEVDSWKARKRLAEFSKELTQLQLTFGNRKLADAEKALVEGQYMAAIGFANEANLITPLLKSKSQKLIELANGRKKSSERAYKASVKTTDPDLENREVKIRKALTAAQLLYRKGQYDDALKKIEEVYVLNPYNADAAYLSTQIYKKFYQIGNMRRRADIRAQFAYEAWQWVEPNFPMPEVPDDNKEDQAMVKTGSDAAIQEKLDSIVFPEVNWAELDLEAVMQFLNDNKKFDNEGKGSGVSITLIQVSPEEKETVKEGDAAEGGAPAAEDGGEGMEGESGESEEAESEEEDGEKSSGDDVYVTLNLKNVTLRQLLDYICFLTDFTYVVRDDGVVFGAPDQQMKTKDYMIYDTVKFLIVNRKPAPPAAAAPAPAKEGGEEGAAAPEGDAPPAEGGGEGGIPEGGGEEGGGDVEAPAPDTVDDSELSPAALQKFFTMYGLEFPKGSSISYFRNHISMNNTAANHLMMEALLKKINIQDDMIEVEVKSIELSENDMEELGFNWAMGMLGEDEDGRQWRFGKGANTSSGGTLNMLNGLLSGVDSRFISNLNIFPDLFGSFKPFGSDISFNLSLTINALDRSDRTEQISAPRVLVRNGFTATVKMTKAYFFPDEWEEMEIETDEVGDNGDVRLNVTPPAPTFAETESEIGTTFTVTPTILEGGNTIRLNLHPKVTAFTGKDEYDVVVKVSKAANDWEVEEMSWVVWRPRIATREVTVTVDVDHGETLVIGGLSDSQSQKRLDKIPILSDIPFIGRLFQNQSEISVRRNMLIFVTARFVNNSGMPRPVNSKVGNGGIPALMR